MLNLLGVVGVRVVTRRSISRATGRTTRRRRRAGRLGSEDAAERATLATLTTLGEHVSSGEADDLVAGLPNGLSGAVTDRSAETPESFTVDEFVGRVINRERGETSHQGEATEQGGQIENVDWAAGPSLRS